MTGAQPNLPPDAPIAELAALVRRMVEASGEPDGFSAEAWLASWLQEACPALGGQRPADLLRAPEGVARVRQVLLCMQSGAYL